MNKVPKKPLTEHDVDAAEIQASVERQKNWLRFGLWLAFIVGLSYVLKACVESPPKLPDDPSVECASKGLTWHPESWTSGIFNRKIEAYCGPPALPSIPCAEKK